MSDDKPFVIYSFQHAAWWAPEERGYVSEIVQAGLYTEPHAREIVARMKLVQHRACAMPLTTAEGLLTLAEIEGDS